MIQITQDAQDHFVTLLSQQEKGTNIRVFVINPGTPNAECGVAYCLPGTLDKTDKEIKFESMSVYIDELSFPYLENAEIALLKDPLGVQLTLTAPHAKVPKISENASLEEQVEYVIRTRINPNLAAHGGHVSLMRITEDGYALLLFGGGCNGCSMINITLQDSIEKELLSCFPNLKGVKDFTEHNRGEHSYY